MPATTTQVPARMTAPAISAAMVQTEATAMCNNGLVQILRVTQPSVLQCLEDAALTAPLIPVQIPTIVMLPAKKHGLTAEAI